MAEQADGRVEIDTELDTSGFIKGSEKLKQAMQGVTRTLDSLAGKAAHAFQEPIKAPQITDFDDDGLEAAISEWEDHEKTLAEQTQQIFDDVDASNLVEQYKSAEAAAERLEKRRKQLQDVMEERAADAYAESHAADEKTFDKYANVIQRNASSISEAFERIRHASEQGFRNTSQVLNFSSNIDAAERRIAELKQAMADLGEMQLLDESQQQRYEALRAEIERIEADLLTSAGLIQQESIEQARLNVLTAQQKVATADNAAERMKAMRELAAAQNELAAAAQKSVTPAPDPSAQTAWERFGEKISNVKYALTNIKDVAKNVGSKLTNGLKSAASGAKKLFSHLKQSKLGTDGLVKKLTSLKTMLMSRIKRTFISFLFNSISDAFKELAKFDSRFDKSVSNLRNRTKELGANIMGALGGLLRQIEPYITSLIEKASGAVQKISAVLATLRGESSVQVAVRQTESYADSLKDATSAANKAKNAQDKLNQTLTSYDEIHKLSGDNSDSDATSEAEKSLYKNVPVASLVDSMNDVGKQIVDKFVQAVKNGDWKGAGNAIAEGANLAIEQLDTMLIKAHDKVVQGAHNIAEALNGLTEGFDAYNFGKTVADAIELGLDSAYEFMTTYDFGKLGHKIADGLNGFMTNLNSEKVGRTIAAAINAAINFGFELVTTLKWDTIGEKIGTTFNRLFRDIDWAKLAKTVSGGVAGLLNSVASFIETLDTEEAGAALVTFLTNIDWAGLAQAMFRLLGAAIGGVSGLIKGAFHAIAEKSEAWGEHLFDEYGSEFNDAGEQVGAGIWKGIKNMFTGAAKKVKENIFDPFINGFKKAFGIASPAKKMEPYGEYVAEGIEEGIKGVFAAPSDWIRNNILEPFKRGFTTAFNVVGDKAQAMLANGKSIANGVKSGIETGWSTVTTTLSQKADLVKGFFKSDDFKQLGTKIIEGIGAGVGDDGEYQSSIGSKLGSLASKISNSVDAEGVKQVGKNIAWLLGAGIGDADTFNDTIGSSISGLASRISDSVDAEGIRQVGKNIAWLLNDGIEQYLSTTPTAQLDGVAADWVSQAKAGRVVQQYNGPKLNAPAIVTGNFAPSGTTPTDEISSDTNEIKQLLKSFVERVTELEELIAGRPIRLESHVEINRRELGLAVAEYNTNTGNIINGNGGAW